MARSLKPALLTHLWVVDCGAAASAVDEMVAGGAVDHGGAAVSWSAGVAR